MADVRLDSGGIQKLLNSDPVASAVHDLAEQIATQVRGQKPEADVVVDRYQTDRAAASVTIRDVRGRTWEVRDGVLTRSAASVGLEVTGRT
jgi:hypothetical protein